MEITVLISFTRVSVLLTSLQIVANLLYKTQKEESEFLRQE